MDPSIEQRLVEALAEHALSDLADRMRVDGLTQAQVTTIFTEFHKTLLASRLEAEADEVADTLDLVVGYCSPAHCLFPPDRYKDLPGQLRLFAAADERPMIIKFILENTDLLVFRFSASDPACLRIETTQDFDPAADTHLSLWSECFGDPYEILTPPEHHAYLFTSDPSLGLFFGDISDRVITISRISLGRRRQPSEAAFASIEPLRKFIDGRSTATALGVPTLPRALDLARSGFELKESRDTRWTYNID